MKRHNLNWSFRIKINSGFALLIFLLSFFGLLFMAAFFQGVEKNFLVASGTLAAAFGGYLRKEHANNQLDLEAAKANVVGNVSEVKQAVYGSQQ